MRGRMLEGSGAKSQKGWRSLCPTPPLSVGIGSSHWRHWVESLASLGRGIGFIGSSHWRHWVESLASLGRVIGVIGSSHWRHWVESFASLGRVIGIIGSSHWRHWVESLASLGRVIGVIGSSHRPSVGTSVPRESLGPGCEVGGLRRAEWAPGTQVLHRERHTDIGRLLETQRKKSAFRGTK
jgi:hypothetical protein